MSDVSGWISPVGTTHRVAVVADGHRAKTAAEPRYCSRERWATDVPASLTDAGTHENLVSCGISPPLSKRCQPDEGVAAVAKRTGCFWMTVP